MTGAIAKSRVLEGRRDLIAFSAGCVAVTVGVLLHLPMFVMGKDMGYQLAGMPMDPPMIWGMALIVGGVMLSSYGVLPKAQAVQAPADVAVTPPEDAPLTATSAGA